MNKAVSYVRVSSKEQEDCFSIPDHLKLFLAYAKEKAFEVVAEFIDDESAKGDGTGKFALSRALAGSLRNIFLAWRLAF